MFEVVGTFGGREGVGGLADDGPELIDGASGGLAEEALSLAKTFSIGLKSGE